MQKFFLVILFLAFPLANLLGENGNYFIAIDIPEAIENPLESYKEMLEKQLFGTFEPK